MTGKDTPNGTGHELTDDEITELICEALPWLERRSGDVLTPFPGLRVAMEDVARLRARDRRRMRKRHRDVTKDPDLVVRAVLATFRHQGKPSFRPAREVMKDLRVPWQVVVALLKEGFAQGLFTVLVSLPQEMMDVVRLEQAVKARFGLKQVLLVPGVPEIMDDLDAEQRSSVQTEVNRAMVQRATERLDAHVAAATVRQHKAAQAGEEVEPFVLGVAWGRTMRLLANHLLATQRPRRPAALQVVPIVGITAALRADPIEANLVAGDLARAYGGLSTQLPCPAFLPADVVKDVTDFPLIRRMLAHIRNCDVVITSMGPIPESCDPAEITLSNDPSTNVRLCNEAREAGAVGEICYWLWDRDGNEVTTSHRGIGLGFEGLRQIAQDPDGEVILISGGDKRRFEPLRIALQAGLASVLVSDTVTARYLVGEI